MILAIGLGILAYPVVANWWNGLHMSDASASYDQTVQEMSNSDDGQLQAMWDAATAYNQTLLTESDRFHLTDDQMQTYLSLLDPAKTGVMGQVVIPKIGVDLPIYHSTNNDVLAAGIGHIPGSSLPVGGPSTHCVISGHRGLPSSELFTNIDQLVEGDTFQLRVLGQTLTYQVDQIRIVLPTEVDSLAIEQGQDLCTLVTCTPYGINTHRLLVRGHRVPNDESSTINADATQVDPQLETLVVFGVLVATVWIVYQVRERRLHGAERVAAKFRKRHGLGE